MTGSQLGASRGAAGPNRQSPSNQDGEPVGEAERPNGGSQWRCLDIRVERSAKVLVIRERTGKGAGARI